MKKLTLSLFLLLAAVVSMAQNAEETHSCVIRKGNTYYVDDMTYSKKGFRLFLSDKDANAYKLFNNGYKLSVGGWACFGAGLGMAAFGAIYYPISTNAYNTAVSRGDHGTAMGEYMLQCYSVALLAVGGVAVVGVGVPLLSVGYSRMHNAADMYNARCKQPAAILSLNADYNGLGLAVNF